MADIADNILNLSDKFLTQLEKVVQEVLVKNGVKSNSELIDSIEWKLSGKDQLEMVVSDYYQYVSTGRKPRTRKIPAESLIRFIKKNNITFPNRSVSQIAFAMQRSIYLNGIKGKHFVEQVEDTSTDYVEFKVADSLEDQIADALQQSFQV